MSLSVEDPLAPKRRGRSPPIPQELSGRDDVTLMQKKRLAMLAKMGIGPVAGEGSAPARRTQQDPLALQSHPAAQGGLPGGQVNADQGFWEEEERQRGDAQRERQARRAAMLEKERKLREEEERQREEEEALEREKREKRMRPRAGLMPLGIVLAREDENNQVPMPMPTKEPGRPEPAPASSSDSEPAEEEAQTAVNEAQDRLNIALRALEAQKAKKAQEPQKPVKKKKRKRRERGDEDWHGGEEDGGEEDEEDDRWPKSGGQGHKPSIRDGGISMKMMVVESTKGKVSRDNRNFTDADLERRFPQQHSSEGSGRMTSESEVLRMISREKQEKGSGNSSRRVQREAAEWAEAKKARRYQTKEPQKFEGRVISMK